MKKKIIILGSTGSIGSNTFDIIKKNSKDFDISLLSTNKNVKKIIYQAKKFNVKHIIINNKNHYDAAKKKYKKLKINFYNSFSIFQKILKKKEIFYTMIALPGLDGLGPILNIIKYTKNIGIANKESLICGWKLIKKELKKNNCNFIPIDSEHFSIFMLIKNIDYRNIKKIFITASGGPFLNSKNFKNKTITINDALNHPNWTMGEKITIDSSTLMNKVFEVIETKNIFNVDFKKIIILTHPKSYVHAIITFNNGFSKLLIHEPNMKIPIHNSIYLSKSKNFPIKNLNFNLLNNLQLKSVNLKQFPLVKLLRLLPEKESLYETALVTINDFFVQRFLDHKIRYSEMVSFIYKYSKNKIFLKLRNKPINSLRDIIDIREKVSLILKSIYI
jgi:1-deoxy-D-xylulose-5-phosphate reductoisomerase